MNQAHSKTSITINSDVIEDHLDSVIINLAQAIQIENSCTVEEAKKIVKNKIIMKLINTEESEINTAINSCISNIANKRLRKLATKEEIEAHKILSSIFRQT